MKGSHYTENEDLKFTQGRSLTLFNFSKLCEPTPYNATVQLFETMIESTNVSDGFKSESEKSYTKTIYEIHHKNLRISPHIPRILTLRPNERTVVNSPTIF